MTPPRPAALIPILLAPLLLAGFWGYEMAGVGTQMRVHLRDRETARKDQALPTPLFFVGRAGKFVFFKSEDQTNLAL